MLPAQLNNLELHDSGIDSLLFDFSNKKIEVGINTTGENSLHLTFSAVKEIEISGFHLEDCELLEIYSHAVDSGNDGYYRITFTLLLGFGKPCGFFQFLFQSCSLNGKFFSD